ncbi:DUF4393 domain-containing protein [Streptococcus constellatus]
MDENNSKNININALPISADTGDAFAKPIATSLGEASKTLLDGVFHLAFDPVRKFNIQREADLERFKQEVNSSVQSIPAEFQDDSKIGLVLKTIEDSKYQLNEEELRAMFTKLITSTLDTRTNSSVSPKYSSIIAEMTSEEAKLLKKIYLNTGALVPIVSLHVINKSTSATRELPIQFLLFDDTFMSEPILATSLLTSSFLIEFNDDKRLTHEHFSRLQDIFVRELPEDLNTLTNDLSDDEEVEVKHSYYSLTELGRNFCKVVLT